MASGEIAEIQLLVDEMNAMAEKGKKRKTREKALVILSLLKSVDENVEREKEEIAKEYEEERMKAIEVLKEAREEGGLVCSQNLIYEASLLIEQADEARASTECRHHESMALLRKSMEAPLLARERAIAERERIRREEEERRRLEVKEVPSSPREETKIWVVRQGESLWKISSNVEIYGDPFMWPLIFWANRSQIKDPNIIYYGQNLKIPRNFKKEEMEEAIKRAKSGLEEGLE
ncbi:MAG: LysM peptidoglycan-binding domain-containing protein [Acidobacteriota bacterium]